MWICLFEGWRVKEWIEANPTCARFVWRHKHSRGPPNRPSYSLMMQTSNSSCRARVHPQPNDSDGLSELSSIETPYVLKDKNPEGRIYRTGGGMGLFLVGWGGEWKRMCKLKMNWIELSDPCHTAHVALAILLLGGSSPPRVENPWIRANEQWHKSLGPPLVLPSRVDALFRLSVIASCNRSHFLPPSYPFSFFFYLNGKTKF